MIRKLVVVLLTGVMCLVGVTSALAVTYNEAPMLRIKVAAGELPPVEERLPEEPFVIPVVEEIGQYGGTIKADAWWFIDRESILHIAPDGSTIIPNVGKKWEFSKDGKTLTIQLRKGIKWSDGVPFTADDLMFAYEDQLLNTELTPVIPESWKTGKDLIKVEKIDDYTIRITMTTPYPFIVNRLAHCWGEQRNFYQPAHYMKQFHPKYTSMEKLNELCKEYQFDKWYQLYWYKSTGVPQRMDMPPTLSPWMDLKATPGYRLLERNPYFWKVDTAGNQLPYIDGILSIVYLDPEVFKTAAAAGEVDISRDALMIEDYPLFIAGAEKGDYRVLLWRRVQGADVCYQPNQTCKDPVLRKIFRDVRFRRAFSLAIDREEINEVIYFGLAVPRQTTVVPYSKYFEPEFARAYADYDPKEANRLLDEMGLKWDENHKWRLRPDGKRLRFLLEYSEQETPKTPTNELVKAYVEAIGIDMTIKLESGELIRKRYPANEVEFGLWHADSCTDVLFPQYGRWFVPIRGEKWYGDVTWDPLWMDWYESGQKAGEEPPEEVKKNYERWLKLNSSADEEERIRLGKEILLSNAENVWTIGTVGCAPIPQVVKNNLRNVPEEALIGWDVMHSVSIYPEQFFFKQK